MLHIFCLYNLTLSFFTPFPLLTDMRLWSSEHIQLSLLITSSIYQPSQVWWPHRRPCLCSKNILNVALPLAVNFLTLMCPGLKLSMQSISYRNAICLSSHQILVYSLKCYLMLCQAAKKAVITGHVNVYNEFVKISNSLKFQLQPLI